MSRSGNVASRLAGRPVARELDADHQPEPADVADPVVLGGDLAEPGDELRAARRGIAQQVLVTDRLEDREAGGARDRVPAESRAVRAASPAILELATRDDRRQRQAVGDRLGHAHHVRDDPGVLEGPHLPGAAIAALDLVGDEQDAVLGRTARGARGGTTSAPGCSHLRPGPAR